MKYKYLYLKILYRNFLLFLVLIFTVSLGFEYSLFIYLVNDHRPQVQYTINFYNII